MAERFEIVEKALRRMLEEKKYQALKDLLVVMNPADVAALFQTLEEEKIPEAVARLSRAVLESGRNA